MSPSDTESDAPEPAASDDVEAVLVEIEDGVAMLFGKYSAADLGLEIYDVPEKQTGSWSVDDAAIASGVANFVAQGAHGAMISQGLVRLAPETMKALGSMTPMTSSGWNLGSLTVNGKIAQSIRWAPVAGVMGISVIGSLATAVALLAVQMQVKSISRRIDENTRQVQKIYQKLSESEWAGLRNACQRVNELFGEAVKEKGVSDSVGRQVENDASGVLEQCNLFEPRLKKHVEGLEKGFPYVAERGSEIYADAHAALLARRVWYQHQLLYAARPGRSREQISEGVRGAREKYVSAVEQTGKLLGEMGRKCRLLSKLPTKDKEAEIVEQAGMLADELLKLGGCDDERSLPPIKILEHSELEKISDILPSVMPGGEPLFAICQAKLEIFVSNVKLGEPAEEAKIDKWVNSAKSVVVQKISGPADVYFGIGSKTFFLSRRDVFRNTGSRERIFGLSEIRYVRFRELGKQGPVLDVITKDENIRITFDEWAAEGEALENARRIGDILATAMNLPEEERGHDPLLSCETLPATVEAR